MFYVPSAMPMPTMTLAPPSYLFNNNMIPTQQGAWVFCPSFYQTPDDAVRHIQQQNKWDAHLLKSVKLFKTELCRAWRDYGRCNYGSSCQYAHGEHEQRLAPAHHPKNKSEPCVMFARYGSCAYGGGCHFVHDDAVFGELALKSKAAPISTTMNSPRSNADSFRWPSVDSLEREALNQQNNYGMPSPSMAVRQPQPSGRLPVFLSITESAVA